MLTVEDLQSLEVGDLIELPGLFRGLSQEPIAIAVIEVDPNERRIVGEGTYFGIRIGCWAAQVKSGRVEWEALG